MYQTVERMQVISFCSQFSQGNSTLLKGNTNAMNSTMPAITIITSEEGRLISQLQHGLWGNGFSSFFHSDCPHDTGNVFELSALASCPQAMGYPYPRDGVRRATPRNIRRSGAMGRSRTLTLRRLVLFQL